MYFNGVRKWIHSINDCSCIRFFDGSLRNHEKIENCLQLELRKKAGRLFCSEGKIVKNKHKKQGRAKFRVGKSVKPELPTIIELPRYEDDAEFDPWLELLDSDELPDNINDEDGYSGDSESDSPSAGF